jgi:hypothetical protein
LNASECTSADERTFELSLHGPGVSGWNGPPGPNFALGEGLDRRGHVGVVGPAVRGVHAVGAGRVGQRPALVGLDVEAETRDLRVAARAQDRVAVDPVEHPAAQAHRLQHQGARIVSRSSSGIGSCSDR